MRSLILGATFGFFAALGTVSSAATLGLTTDTPSLTSSASIVDFFDFDPDGDLSSSGNVVDSSDGVSPTGLTEIGFGIGYTLNDPTGDFAGGFDVFDDNGEFLAGDLIAVGFTEDVIELQFGNLAGSAAGDFTSTVLALITFDAPLGANPFSSLFDGDSLDASIDIFSVVDSNMAPIPLPAGLPLLLGGLGVLGFLRRKQRT